MVVLRDFYKEKVKGTVNTVPKKENIKDRLKNTSIYLRESKLPFQMIVPRNSYEEKSKVMVNNIPKEKT